jgi:hypothetical protein
MRMVADDSAPCCVLVCFSKIRQADRSLHPNTLVSGASGGSHFARGFEIATTSVTQPNQTSRSNSLAF